MHYQAHVQGVLHPETAVAGCVHHLTAVRWRWERETGEVMRELWLPVLESCHPSMHSGDWALVLPVASLQINSALIMASMSSVIHVF